MKNLQRFVMAISLATMSFQALGMFLSESEEWMWGNGGVRSSYVDDESTPLFIQRQDMFEEGELEFGNFFCDVGVLNSNDDDGFGNHALTLLHECDYHGGGREDCSWSSNQLSQQAASVDEHWGQYPFFKSDEGGFTSESTTEKSHDERPNRKLPTSKSPVLDAFIYCVREELGAKFQSTRAGIVNVVDFDAVMMCVDDNANKNNPTTDYRSRIKALQRWFTGFPAVAKGGHRLQSNAFTLTVTPNMGRALRARLNVLSGLADESEPIEKRNIDDANEDYDLEYRRNKKCRK